MISRAFELFADYHQFYVWDAGIATWAPEDYTDEDIRRRVKVGPHVVVVQPVRQTTVPVSLSVHERDPGYDVGAWDHVVECGLALPTGRLQVHECTGGAVLDVSVSPSSYAVRVLFEGLDSLSEDRSSGNDRYVLDLWPATSSPTLRVVKQWQPAG